MPNQPLELTRKRALTVAMNYLLRSAEQMTFSPSDSHCKQLKVQWFPLQTVQLTN